MFTKNVTWKSGIFREKISGAAVLELYFFGKSLIFVDLSEPEVLVSGLFGGNFGNNRADAYRVGKKRRVVREIRKGLHNRVSNTKVTYM